MSEEKNTTSRRRRKRRKRDQKQNSRGSHQPRRNDSQGEQGSDNSNRRRRRRRRSRKGNSGGDSGSNNNGSSNNASSDNKSNSNSKGRNRRKNNNGGGSNKNGRRRNNNRSNNSNNSNNRRRNNNANTPASKFGGRDPVNPDAGQDRDGDAPELTAFELFCAYHLGITEDNGYRKPRARDIAKRFDISINEMHDAMQRLQIDKNAFERYNFDLSLAQLDIRVAPDGVDRREIAKVHYDELCELNPELGQPAE